MCGNVDSQTGDRHGNAGGVSLPQIRALAREIGKGHALVGDLWGSGIYEARLLAGMVVFAHGKAVAWSARPEEFVKRAAFALIAVLAVHDKKAPDQVFEDYLPIIEREAGDDRAMVAAAGRIQLKPSRAAKWVASDALRELTSDAVQKRLRSRT